MERSRVFQELNYLFSLKNAVASARRHLIRQITAGQIDAIAEIMRRLTTRSIPINQRDAYIFEDQKLTMRNIGSRQVNTRRKMRALLRHHSLLARVLRPQYIYQTIAAEISDTMYMADE
jgi:hypothetical protein